MGAVSVIMQHCLPMGVHSHLIGFGILEVRVSFHDQMKQERTYEVSFITTTVRRGVEVRRRQVVQVVVVSRSSGVVMLFGEIVRDCSSE